MFNPKDPTHLRKLGTTLDSSLKEGERARINRMKFYKELLGKHAPYPGTAARRHKNLLDLATTIYKQALVPYQPRCSLTARHRDLRGYALSFELAINHVLAQPNVADEIEICVMESMFSPLGVVKVMLDASDVVTVPDGMGGLVQVSIGTPRLRGITHDNWVQDMSAAHPNAVAFCGDRYFVDRDSAMNDGVYDPDVVERIPTNDRERPRSDDSQSVREMHFWEDHRDLIEVWDIWLPDDGLLLTLPKDFKSTPPLRIVEWSGPQYGPYERLFYGINPGNSLPSPPISMWYDLHETTNRLYNKTVNQAERQKTVDLVESGDQEDGEKLKNAKDGDMVSVTRLAGKGTIRTGGPDNVTLGFTRLTADDFNLVSGNPLTLGGLQVGSGTVGQDQMLSEGASQRLRNMQGRVRGLLRCIVKQIGEYLWESPLVDIPIQKQLPGGRTVQSTWNSQMMPGEFPDYLIDIDPYSLGDRTPQERLMQLQSVWRDDIMPALPIMQASGQVPNFEGYIKQVAKLGNLPEVSDLVTYAQGEMMPSTEPTQKPQTTTRKYERVSKAGGMTDRGQEQQFVNKLLSGSDQKAGTL